MKKNAKIVYIISAFTTIFVTIFAIISLSYSWYVRQTDANISSVTMSAAGVSGIQLSGNGTIWKNELSTQDSDIYINPNLKIDSVSTSGEVVNGNLLFYKGSYTQNGFETTLLTESNIYHVFDFYVLNNDIVTKALKLGINSTVIDTNDKDLALSTRVAFINLGYSETLAGISQITGAGVNEVDYIWEPNSTVRSNRVGLYHTSYIPEGKTPYQGVNRAASGLSLVNNLIVNSESTPEEEVVSVTTQDPIGAGDNNEITLIRHSSITKIRVFIWCEGQDIDCNNSITGGTAEINFSFHTHDMQQNLEEDYVAAESFTAPTLTANSAVSFSWLATSTSLSTSTFSTNYIFRISTLINDELITVRTVFTTVLTIDINNLNPFKMGGQYFVDVRVYSPNFGDSEFSNQLGFEAFSYPESIQIVGSTITWAAAPNVSSYTIRAIDKADLTEYTVITSSINNDLTALLFDGSAYLLSGHSYFISVKSNQTTSFAGSDYSAQISWEN